MADNAPLLFRADSSERMGTGHVMRCLALAQAAQDEGRRAVYVMAQRSAGVAERMRAEDIAIANLQVEPGSLHDALATVDVARFRGTEWIILDGYHFDAAYQAAIKRAGLKLLALDDFGNWEHYSADIVLNQDPIADERLYTRREACTRLLLGSEYTFLRREFRQFPRPAARVPAVARRLLLTFGGSDPCHLTETALAALESVSVEGLETVILVGPSNPRWEALQAAVGGRDSIRLLRNPPDIPQWMAWCDLAVIAAGSTIWELAYCRVPSLMVMVDEDQAPSTDLLQRRGACVSLGNAGQLTQQQLAATITNVCNDAQQRMTLGANLAAMVDGRGAKRVLEAMHSTEGAGQ